MQTCSYCQTQIPDLMEICPSCQADLRVASVQASVLKKFQDNPRVKLIRVAVSADCCPVCQKLDGTYEKQDAPVLPANGCSHENGCRCFYEPILTEIFP